MKKVDFYFSIGSTYTYLTVTRILDIEKKLNVKFNWVPFSVRVIMKEMNNIPFPKDKQNKVDYMWRDIERRAKGYGFFAKTPVPYPLSEFDLANKLAILGLKEGWGIDYVRTTYKRWFQEAKEPATEPNISEICTELKIDKEKVISEANSEEIEKELAMNICMHIAALNPMSIDEKGIDNNFIENEKKIIIEQLKDDKKPSDILNKIIDGKISNEYSYNFMVTRIGIEEAIYSFSKNYP